MRRFASEVTGIAGVGPFSQVCGRSFAMPAHRRGLSPRRWQGPGSRNVMACFRPIPSDRRNPRSNPARYRRRHSVFHPSDRVYRTWVMNRLPHLIFWEKKVEKCNPADPIVDLLPRNAGCNHDVGIQIETRFPAGPMDRAAGVPWNGISIERVAAALIVSEFVPKIIGMLLTESQKAVQAFRLEGWHAAFRCRIPVRLRDEQTFERPNQDHRTTFPIHPS